MKIRVLLLFVFLALLPTLFVLTHGEEVDGEVSGPEKDLKPESIPSKTDDEVIEREEDKMTVDGFSVHDLKLMREKAEVHQFEAEVNSLMKIIINSLYSNKEVFLREVISNASDALDKIRFLSLKDPSQLDTKPNLEIKIKADPEGKALHITDTGIGMTKDDLVNVLGTIAKSGTAAFLEAYKNSGDSSLIGQFGVGFYSIFLVADSVTVITKHNDSDKQWVWQSDSKGSFSVIEDPRGNTLGRGTQITLHMKDEDAEEFLSEDRLKHLVKKYSEFITFPIYLWASHEEEKEVLMTEEEIEAEKAEETNEEEETEEEIEEETEEETEEEAPRTKKVVEVVWDWEMMNETKPLWTRNPKEITEEEYNQFYKSFTKETSPPLTHYHFFAEGDVEFKSLLYIPSVAPTNLWEGNNEDVGRRIKLYVKRVFITDDFKDILPKYLHFIYGLVDSDDLPLNVSREMLQENRILKLIKKKLVRKVIAMIQKLASGEKVEQENAEEEEETEGEEKREEISYDKYKKFWKNYATNIKLGVIEDPSNRSRLSKLLMFHSSKTGDLTFLSDYVSRMKEGQNQIYYLAGASKEAVETSPLIEKLIKKGYEVLYMIDPIDEYALANMDKFDGKYKLTNIGKEGLEFEDDEVDEEKKKDLEQKFQPLIDFLKKNLSDKVEKVLISKRLTNSPSALVSSTYGWTANMERIISAQALGGDTRAQKMYQPKKVLEINPNHPIIVDLLKRVEVDENDQVATDTARLMYDTAVLSSGYSLDEPSDFAGRIHRMINLSLNVNGDAKAEEDSTLDENAKDEL